VSTWFCHIANIQGASCTYIAHHELESVVVIVITAHQVEHHTLLIPSAVQSDEQHVKLVLGYSYIYTDGKLTSVPASRAAVFRDRTLGPMVPDAAGQQHARKPLPAGSTQLQVQASSTQFREVV